MNTKNKKVFFIWVLVVIGILLASCQSLTIYLPTPVSNTPTLNESTVSPSPVSTLKSFTETATSVPSASINVNETNLKGITIHFWYSWSDVQKDILKDLVNEFNQYNPWGITVQANYQGPLDLLYTNLKEAIDHTGNLPNITPLYLFQAKNLPRYNELFIDVSPYLYDSKWGFSAVELDNLYLSILDKSDKKQILWGFPAWYSAEFLFYNHSWANELGFNSPPSKPDEFQAQSCTSAKANIKKENKDSDLSGGWLINTQYSTTLSWMRSFNANILLPKEQGYQFDTDEVNQSFEFLRKLYEEQCATITESQVAVSEFAKRQGLFMSGDLSDAPLLIQEFARMSNADNWSIIPFPSISGKAVMNGFGQSYLIFKTSETEQLASWLFIKWLSTPEIHARIALSNNSLPFSAFEASILQDQNTSFRLSTIYDLIPYMKHEPELASWNMVRWTLSDATKQLYQWYFKADQIPILIKLLDKTANDLHNKKE